MRQLGPDRRTLPMNYLHSLSHGAVEDGMMQDRRDDSPELLFCLSCVYLQSAVLIRLYIKAHPYLHDDYR